MMEPEMRTFDTHKHIKELTRSGLKEPQAEAIVKSLMDSREHDFSKLATKEQLSALEVKLDTVEMRLAARIDSIEIKLNALKENLTGQIKAVESNILKWILPLFLTTWAMIAGIIFK